MEKRTLGNSNLTVSAIGYGSWGIGGKPFWETEGDDISIGSIRKAFDLGITLYDTAPVYGFGHAEILIGKTLKDVRNHIVLATKCGLRWKTKSPKSIYQDCSQKSIEQEIDASLRRLQTDWIDLYQVHWPDNNTAQEETIEVLLKIQKTGKIRHIGVSNYSLSRLRECMGYAPIISLQTQYNLLERRIEESLIPFCRENKIGILAYSPLASGILSGKYNEKTQFKDWRKYGAAKRFNGKAFSKNINKVELFKQAIATSPKCCTQWAIRWTIDQPGITSALVGVKNQKQIEENVETSWQMGEHQCRQIEEIFPSFRKKA